MTLRVETQNSVYEVDEANMRIRQLAGLHTTPRLTPQGTWRMVEEIVITHNSMTIVWEEDPNRQLRKYTRTSPVLSVQPMAPTGKGRSQ